MAHDNSENGSPGACEESVLHGSSGLSPVAVQILESRILPSQLNNTGGPEGDWLWQGYLGPGKMMLLTSQWKSGKTTLVSVLLRHMEAGGELAGMPVRAGRAAVFAEENLDLWRQRRDLLGFKDHVHLFCNPFRGKPTMAHWLGLIESMLHLRRQVGLDLVVIDSLVTFLPGNSENSADAIMECLHPLRDLTSAGMSVLLLHHPRKGSNLPGQAARGSGALPSQVDIVTEMSWHTRTDPADRRRWLHSDSRYRETPRLLILELNAEGNDYLVHEPTREDECAESWNILGMVLSDASERLTQRLILKQWPEDFRKPNQGTISRLLKRGIDQGKIRQGGSGRKDDPFHYWRPEKEDDFAPLPGASDDQIKRYYQREGLKTKQFFEELVKNSLRLPDDQEEAEDLEEEAELEEEEELEDMDDPEDMDNDSSSP